MNNPATRPAFHPVVLHSVVCALIFMVVYFLEVYCPVAYTYFVNEDSWVEYGTFACYLLAAVLIFWALKKDHNLRRPGYVLFCLGLFFVAMEEISWGQRFFGIRTPHLIAQFNQQSELSLHNVPFFPAEHLFFYAIVFWAVILPEISYRSQYLNKFLKSFGIPLAPREIYSYFILGFLYINSQIVIETHELGELLTGLGFVLLAVDLRIKIPGGPASVNLNKGRAAGVAILIILAITAVLVLAGPQEVYSLKRRLHKSAATDYPKHGMNGQAIKLFEYLLRHEKLRNNDTLFQYGVFLKKLNRSESEGIFLQALEEAKTGMAQNPDKSAPNILAGKIFKELNQPGLARKEFTEALRKDQIRFDQAKLDWQKADALKSMGEAYIEMGESELAKEHLQKAMDYTADGWTKRKIKKLFISIDSR